ncbi:MAG: hypothetical protein ACOZCO_04365 [Bacteroidota bacterium]
MSMLVAGLMKMILSPMESAIPEDKKGIKGWFLLFVETVANFG